MAERKLTDDEIIMQIAQEYAEEMMRNANNKPPTPQEIHDEDEETPITHTSRITYSATLPDTSTDDQLLELIEILAKEYKVIDVVGKEIICDTTHSMGYFNYLVEQTGIDVSTAVRLETDTGIRYA